MDDEVSMRVVHDVAHILEELKATIDRQLAGVAPAVDRLAFDQLHREVRNSVGRDAAIDEPRDARMLEQRQNPPFLAEATRDAGRALYRSAAPIEIHRRLPKTRV